MRRFCVQVLLAFLGVLISNPSEGKTPPRPVGPRWPMALAPDLSSGFGDPRDGRFHAGIDLRTDGVIGQRVFAPVNGSITRLRASYTGYGKAIYLTDSSGQITVYAHLSAFAPRLDSLIKRVQVASRRYLVDLPIAKDSIRIQQGEIIGWSGQTGVGAPHLHFEVRTPDNYPINPLKSRFSLPDNQPPRLKNLMVQLLDGDGFLTNGQRQAIVPLVPNLKGGFRLQKPLVMNHPFGFLLEDDDRLRPDGMSVAVYSHRIEIDRKVVYATRFDSLDFESGSSVRLEYDYLLKSTENREAHAFFAQPGNERTRGVSPEKCGRLGSSIPLTYGKHDLLITLTDAAGNTTSVSGTMYWVPSGVLDSVISVKQLSDTTRQFSIRPHSFIQSICPSVEVELGQGENWIAAPRTSVKRVGEMWDVTVNSGNLALLCLRLNHHTVDGAQIVGDPFTKNSLFGVKSMNGSHEILPDGLHITLRTNSRQALTGLIRLYRDSTLLDTVFTHMINLGEYAALIAPSQKFDKITRMDYFLAALDSTGKTVFTKSYFHEDSLYIAAVGYHEQDTLPFSPDGALIVERTNLFAPCFVELKENTVANKSGLGIVADHFKLLPEQMPLRESLRLRLLLRDTTGFARRSGMVWLDEKKNKWTWMPSSDLTTSSSGPFVVSALTNGGGSFSIAQDLNPPEYTNMSIVPGRFITDPQPKISFRLTDDLAGVPDDRAIELYIDKDWMIPEFDPEQSLCTFQPLTPLTDGEHRIAMKLRDRAGNEKEEYLRFTVTRESTSSKPKKK